MYYELLVVHNVIVRLITPPLTHMCIYYLHQELGAIVNLNFYTTRQMLTATNMHIFQEPYLTGIISLRT